MISGNNRSIEVGVKTAGDSIDAIEGKVDFLKQEKRPCCEIGDDAGKKEKIQRS